MSTDKDLANTNNDSAENNPEKTQNIDLTDHPGLQKISKNPNPRANENLSDSESDADTRADTDDKTDEVGSEITDGEAG